MPSALLKTAWRLPERRVKAAQRPTEAARAKCDRSDIEFGERFAVDPCARLPDVERLTVMPGAGASCVSSALMTLSSDDSLCRLRIRFGCSSAGTVLPGIMIVPGNLGLLRKHAIAREMLHKLWIDVHTGRNRVRVGAEKEWTSWTGGTRPAAVRWTRSCSSPSGTAVPRSAR